jgi:hypothetical protein
MPGIAPQIDYAARTFDVIRERALELLKRRITEFRYNDVIQSGVVPAIIDVLSWFHEQNAHYYDRRFRNSLLILADTREAMVVLTRALGYRMRPATSASVAVRATPTPPQAVPITLRKGTRATTEGGLTFEVAEDFVIPAGKPFWPDGTTDDLIVLVEGATREETFVSDGTQFQAFELGQPATIEGSVAVSILGEVWDEVDSLVFIEGDRRGRDGFTSDGTDGQTFELRLLNAIIDPEDEDGLVVIVTPLGMGSDGAEKWQQVPALTGAAREFVASQDLQGVTTLTFGVAADGAAPPLGAQVDVLYLIAGAQKRYQLTYDTDDRATIRFGDGVFGIIPPAGATITVTYRTGGGARGNIGTGQLNTVIQGVLPSGAATPVAIRNFEPGRGGEPQETVEHARFFAPRFAKSNERAVTREDFTTLSATYFDSLYGAPSHAAAFLKQRRPELNTVCVAVWGRDEFGQLSTANSPLKLGIKNLLDSKRTITTVVEMKDGVVVLVDIEADITLVQGKVRAAVFAELEAALQRFFQSTAVLPGINVSISQLYDTFQNVAGVERVEITRITGSVRVTTDVFILLGTGALVPAVGDGSVNLFQGQFAFLEGTTIVPKSVVITDGIQQVVDNGEGAFSGDVDPLATPGQTTPLGNAMDYETGKFFISFATAPTAGAAVTAQAKLEVFFPKTENLGASDGNVSVVDGATDYYPIVRRAPRGLWSGDRRQVVDSFRVGATNQVRGRLPRGILPTTLLFVEGTPQTVFDNGAGTLLSGVTPVGTVNYLTGDFDFTYPLPIVLPIVATWTTRTVDLFMPADLLPLQAGRLFVWGGFDKDGTQPPGALIAYDDGEGNIAGNVIPGGTISYEDGRVLFEWNATPPPGPAAGALLTGTITQARDGIRRVFDFTFPGDLSSGSLDGEGRTRFQLSSLSTPGFVVVDAYDNWQGKIQGVSLDRLGENTIQYAGGTGRLTFLSPPPVGTPGTFPIQVTNVATFLYAGWVFRVKTPGAAGLDKGLFADNTGRLWGPPAAGPSDPFPVAFLDYLRGRFFTRLAGSPIAAGRDLLLTYDALTRVPPALDIVVAGNQVAALGAVALTEKPQGASVND